MWTVICTVGIFGLPIVFWGGLNEDEGWYPYVGNLLYEGSSLYKDVMFTQTPISAYVYGFVYHFINSSILTGRLTAFLIYLAAAIIIYLALARLFNPRAALISSLIAVLCPLLPVGIGLPLTYPIAIFFISLSLLVYSYNIRWKYILIGILIGLACMTRLTAIFVVFFFIFLHRDKLRPLLIGCLIGILPFAYIFLQSPQATIFGLSTYHFTWGVAGLDYWLNLKWTHIVGLAVIYLPLLLLYALNRFKYSLVALAAIGAVALVHWIPLQTFTCYSVFMIPIIGYAAAENISHIKSKLVLIPLIITTILMGNITQATIQPQQLEDTRNMVAYLQEITEPGEQVFTYHTYIVIEAGLTVDKRQAMSVFSYWLDGTISEDKALLVNAITSKIEKQMLEEQPRILILDDYEENRMNLSNYEVVKHYDKFGQFQRPFNVWLLKENGDND